MTLVLKMFFHDMKRILFFLFAAWLMAQTVDARIYAVCVGLSDYPGTRNDLTVSANDARSMSKLLKDNSAGHEVKLLTNQNATLSNVRNMIYNTFLAAGPNDDIVFYFSGHGIRGSFVCYNGMLTYSSILATMGRSRARSKVIYADACYAGDIRQNRGRANSRTPKNVMFFLSSRSNERSQEWYGHPNSKFTAFLLEGLRGAADTDRNRVVTAIELYTYVKSRLSANSRIQHCVMWGNFERNMPLMRWR